MQHKSQKSCTHSEKWERLNMGEEGGYSEVALHQFIKKIHKQMTEKDWNSSQDAAS